MQEWGNSAPRIGDSREINYQRQHHRATPQMLYCGVVMALE